MTSLDDRIPAPTYGDFIYSLEAVIAVARSNPADALYVDGRKRDQTLRQLLADATAQLAFYEPELAAKLVRAVEE